MSRLQTLASTLVDQRREIIAGVVSFVLSLPICVASGVLVFGALGPSYVAAGASAGLCGAIAAGLISAVAASSSFITTSPAVSTSLILASLITALSTSSAVAIDNSTIVVAVFLCALLAGLWQCVFGLAGVAKVVKFTPHPVLVGFLNGVAVLVAVSQLKPYFFSGGGTSGIVLGEKPWMFLSVLGVAALMLYFPMLARKTPASLSLTKIPPVLAGFIIGIVAYYFLKWCIPTLDLGPTIGDVQVTFASPFFKLNSIEFWRDIRHFGWEIVSVSVVLAIVATMNSLLAFRSAQNVSELQISPVRDLLAQGIGNCAAAVAGGVTSTAAASPTLAAYRAGGRSRLTPVLGSLILLALTSFFPTHLAGIPAVVLSGILLAVGILLFDDWTFQLLSDLRKGASARSRLRCFYDLLVILIVMGVTTFYSIVAGVIAGCLLAGVIFIMNMSRAVVRRTFLGSDIFSKRIRPAKDMSILRETGSQRVVLQLEGVLFFGNADSLSATVKQLFQQAEMIALDMRGISDIDVSGANILANLLNKSRELKKVILFCNVPPTHADAIGALVRRATVSEQVIKSDLDSALEWMEEKSLLGYADRRGLAYVLRPGEIDFFSELDALELATVCESLMLREFAAGEIVCREGEEGDRMWLLAKGSVSVRLALGDGREGRRVSSLARGTTFGEMVLLESGLRSATIVADEPVVCYELRRESFTKMLAEHPVIATKLLSNLARELTRRLRQTSEELRNVSS